MTTPQLMGGRNPVPGRDINGLGAGLHPQFAKDNAQVCLDGPVADPELPGDQLVRQTAQRRTQHFALAQRQPRKRLGDFTQGAGRLGGSAGALTPASTATGR